MKLGTKSILFGAHQCLIHPCFVALAWWVLYGFPLDPRLWVAFFVHDLGYLGKPNMDGPEGERHPELGARIMRLFDGRAKYKAKVLTVPSPFIRQVGFDFSKVKKLENEGWLWLGYFGNNESRMMKTTRLVGRWEAFVLYHSRYYAKLANAKPSQLCFADKLSFCYTPYWLYMPLARLTGEINEYLRNAQRNESEHWRHEGFDAKLWHRNLYEYMRKWVETHKDGADDTWTSADRHAGVAR